MNEMRKVTVTRKDEHWCHVCSDNDSQEWSVPASKFIFGGLSPEGEPHSYYIIPAGDAVEFDITNGAHGILMELDCGSEELTADACSELFGCVPKYGDAMSVACIVHPPEVKPEPPPKLRQGWFEKDGITWNVLDKDNGSRMPYVIVPLFHGRSHIGDGDLKAHKIEIHWYEETA